MQIYFRKDKVRFSQFQSALLIEKSQTLRRNSLKIHEKKNYIKWVLAKLPVKFGCGLVITSHRLMSM